MSSPSSSTTWKLSFTFFAASVLSGTVVSSTVVSGTDSRVSAGVVSTAPVSTALSPNAVDPAPAPPAVMPAPEAAVDVPPETLASEPATAPPVISVAAPVVSASVDAALVSSTIISLFSAAEGAPVFSEVSEPTVPEALVFDASLTFSAPETTPVFSIPEAAVEEALSEAAFPEASVVLSVSSVTGFSASPCSDDAPQLPNFRHLRMRPQLQHQPRSWRPPALRRCHPSRNTPAARSMSPSCPPA